MQLPHPKNPSPYEIWIAYRTDNPTDAKGTASDPYDGTSRVKFDDIMRAVQSLASGTKVCVHLGPSPRQDGTPQPFETDGYCNSGEWSPVPGMRMVGSGMDVTFLKIVSTGGFGYAIGHAPEPLRTGEEAYTLPRGIGVVGVGHGLISENVIDLGNPNSIGYYLSDTVRCFQNRRSSGELIRGHDATYPDDKTAKDDELATRIEDAYLMAF